MDTQPVDEGRAPGPAGGRAARPRKRLLGLDAARGFALVGLLAVQIVPDYNEDTGEPSLVWTLFAGDSAALFALLAGVGLALYTGGQDPHRGRRMTGDRVAVAVRAVAVAAIGLFVGALMPAEDAPADGILLYYAVFFLLAIPFLGCRAPVLFAGAAACAVLAPLLMQHLVPLLPGWTAHNPTVATILAEPAAVPGQLLLGGTYPALPYLAYLLAGLGLGRLNLRSVHVQAGILAVGVALAVLATVASSVLLYASGGYEALLDTGVDEDWLDEAIDYGPDALPDTSAWWLALTTPHTNTPLAIASGLGMAMIAVGLFQLLALRAGRWLVPLAAMGTMTLTLYTGHLIALSRELHYDEPALWFWIHLAVALGFAWTWNRWFGRGPLEGAISWAMRAAQGAVARGAAAEPAADDTTDHAIDDTSDHTTDTDSVAPGRAPKRPSR